MLDGKEVTESWLQFKATNECFEWTQILLDILRMLNSHSCHWERTSTVAGDRRSQRMRHRSHEAAEHHCTFQNVHHVLKIEDIFQNLHEVLNKWGWKVFFTLPIPIHMASPKASFFYILPGWTEAFISINGWFLKLF